jgi:mannose-1-phosphate guanylyltransferase
MNVMLLAAGEGTRLRPYTHIRPKPAIPFMNIPLAAYPLAFLEDLPLNRLVVNTFHLPTKVIDLFVSIPHGARHLHFSHETERILGNGGGLEYARDYFVGQGDLILMNSDEVILPIHPQQVQKALELHRSSRAFCTLITMNHPGVGTQFGGVWLDDAGQVQGFGLTPPNLQSKTAEHFIGIQILSEEIFNFLPKGGVASNILYDGVSKAIAAGKKVQRHNIDCLWYETGNPKDFLHATMACMELMSEQKVAAERVNPRKHLINTIQRFSREAPQIIHSEDCNMLKHSTAKVDSSARLSGFSVIGAGAEVPANCNLRNTVIGDGVIVPADTIAENEIIL